MANNVFTMEEANLFCGNADPSASNHLTLSEMKLPGLEKNYVDHSPGGAQVMVEIDTHYNKLESTFVLAGWTPQVMGLIGGWSQQLRIFTAWGVIRDRRNGTALEAMAIMGGQLGRSNPANWTKGALQHWEYSIKGITHYQLVMAGTEIYYWDFFENSLRVGGAELNTDINSILKIPSAAAAAGL